MHPSFCGTFHREQAAGLQSLEMGGALRSESKGEEVTIMFFCCVLSAFPSVILKASFLFVFGFSQVIGERRVRKQKILVQAEREALRKAVPEPCVIMEMNQHQESGWIHHQRYSEPIRMRR